ncbi:MAG TPA: IS200/IS605 family transposase [Candidatus Angelobacter sp.]
MSHAFVKNHIHLVFSTKDRRPIIATNIQPELWSYLAGICRNQGMAAIAINGMDDHAHILFHLPPTIALAEAVRLLKSNSSKWMNEHGRRFAWQEGYGGFSVSISNTAAVAKYIRDQEKHHRKMTFEQEYRALLKKHGIDPDAE